MILQMIILPVLILLSIALISCAAASKIVASTKSILGGGSGGDSDGKSASTSSASLAESKPFTTAYAVFSSGGGLVNTWEPQVTVTNDGNIYIFATNLNGVTACLDCGTDPIIYRKLTIGADGSFNWVPIKGAATANDDYTVSSSSPSSDNDVYDDDFSKSFVSVNDGNNFAYINPGPLIWFADIVVVPDVNNHLYATYIGFSGQPWNILFQRSTDNGVSWSAPVSVSANYSADKNWIAVDFKNSSNIYVTFNSQWPVATSSTNGGITWTKPQILDKTLSGSYFYAGGSAMTSNGAVYFAYVATPNRDEETEEDDASIKDDYYHRDDDYGIVHNQTKTNFTYARVYASFDRGNSWVGYNISTWMDVQTCPDWAQCSSDFFTGSCSIAADVSNNVYYLYNGDDNSTTSPETRVMLTMKSSNSEVWSTPRDVSDAPTNQNVYHVSVFLATGKSAAGDVRVAWMDNRTSAWNVYYRESTDFGATFTASVRLSTTNNFGNFQSSDGFQFPYGDYGGMTVDTSGNTHIVWGEGMGWYAGGTVFYATQNMGDGSDTTSSSSNDSMGTLNETNKIIVSVVVTAVLSMALTVFILYCTGYVNFQAKKAVYFDDDGASQSVLHSAQKL